MKGKMFNMLDKSQTNSHNKENAVSHSQHKNDACMRLLVAIPCLNEAETITDVINDIPRDIPGIKHVDILVIDDGSTDKTSEKSRDAGVIVLRHQTNRGVGAAFQSAVEYAVENNYDLMVNIDGDRQFNPVDIPKLIMPILEGNAEMVTASRFLNSKLIPKEMPRVKLIGNYVMSFVISWLVRVRFADVSCGFRCYSREALLRMNLLGAFTYTQETFLDLTSKNIEIREIPIEVRYYNDRKSRVANSIFRYAMDTGKIIFRAYRDYFPLRFFSWISVMFAIPSIFFGVVFIWNYEVTGRFSGYLYAGFSAAFLFAMAIVFFVLGLVTDMLVRIRTNQERIIYTLKKYHSHSLLHSK